MAKNKKNLPNKLFMVEDDLTGRSALNLVSKLDRMPTHQWNRMYLDCGNVKKVDATGLAVLVRLYSQLTAKGKQLILIDVPQTIKDVFSRHGLQDLFRCTSLDSKILAR